MPNWKLDDGGRAKAGYKGLAGDCVCRAIAIATGTPYGDVYDAINREAQTEKLTRFIYHQFVDGENRDGTKTLSSDYLLIASLLPQETN